ncbi:MAG: oligosaccharide flippase family protein [bacterium]
MIARQSTLVVANSVLGAAQGFLCLFIVFRYMGDAVWGGRVYALGLVALVGIAARLGLPTTHVRSLARGDDVGRANGTFLALKAWLTAGFMVAGLLGGWVWFGLLHKGASDTTPAALWIAFWVVVVQSLRDVPVTSFQGLRLIREREAVLLSNTFVTTAGTVLVGIAFAASYGRWLPWPALGDWAMRLLHVHGPLPPDTGLTWLMVAFLAGEVVALALAVGLFLWRRIPIARPGPGMMRSYMHFTVPLMFLAVGEVITKSLSVVMVGYWGSGAEVGDYGAAAKLTEVLMLLAPSIAIVLLPAVSNLHARKDEANARKLIGEAERWVSLLLWPIVAVLVVIPGAVVHVLLSDQGAGAVRPLAILSVQAILASLVIPVQMYAIGSGAPRLAARTVMLSAVATAVLGAILIPRHIGPVPMMGWGGTGAAVATLAATAFALVMYAVPSGTWKGHSFTPRAVRHVAAAAVAGAVAFFLPTPTRFVSLAATALACLLVYAVALVALRELRGADWQSLRRLVRRTEDAAEEPGGEPMGEVP